MKDTLLVCGFMLVGAAIADIARGKPGLAAIELVFSLIFSLIVLASIRWGGEKVRR